MTLEKHIEHLIKSRLFDSNNCRKLVQKHPLMSNELSGLCTTPSWQYFYMSGGHNISLCVGTDITVTIIRIRI